jgi:hypothetical protein
MRFTGRQNNFMPQFLAAGKSLEKEWELVPTGT